jgi:hypothetical protein
MFSRRSVRRSGTESSQTLCWSKGDSNSRSHPLVEMPGGLALLMVGWRPAALNAVLVSFAREYREYAEMVGSRSAPIGTPPIPNSGL